MSEGGRLGRGLRRLNQQLWPRLLLHGPSWLILGVNTACNLRCRMCDVGTGEVGSNFHHHMTSAPTRQMPMALAERAIDQLARHYPRARLGFAFTEPGAWPHLTDAVRRARQRGLRTQVTTNGWTLPRLAEGLAEAGLDELVVSLDGPPEVHDQIRGREGSYARAVEGLRRALAAPRPPRASVYCAITPWNVNQLAALAHHLRDLPLQRLGFMHTVFVSPRHLEAHREPWGAAWPAAPSNTQGMAAEDVDLDRLEAEMGRLSRARWPFPIQWSPSLPDRPALERWYRGAGPAGRRCTDVFEHLLLRSDGTVVPAHSRCYNVVAGNLYEAELPELWRSPALSQLRHDLSRAGGLFPGCSRCCSVR